MVGDGVQAEASGTARQGTATFLFSDVEGSTSTLARLGGDAYAEVLADHHALIRAAIERHEGEEIGTAGDGFFIVFDRASDAIAAALDAQRSIAAHQWPEGVALRVRMGIHTGEVLVTETGHVGMTVHAAARVSAVAHGGQVLVSDATRAVVAGLLPEGATLRSLGEHRLKDIEAPQALHQLCHPDLVDAFPPIRSLDLRRHSLPTPATKLIGRNGEVEAVMGLLGRERLVTLAGSGGAGKTRLAIEVASQLLGQMRDGAWFVDLAPLTDPSAVSQAVASAVGVSAQGGAPVEDAVLEYLKPRELLLVLDNCEHLVASCAEIVASIAGACPGVRVLATSREALGAVGEVVHRVPSLDVADEDADPVTLRGSAAVQLFCDRAALVVSDYAPEDKELAVVATICRRLDGLPLAIELAAARRRVLSANQIAERLDDRFRLLTGGSKVALARQQTLHAAVAWSYELLTVEEQALLRRLSVFAGGWGLEAAEAVCGADPIEPLDVLDLLTALIDKSLVVVQDGPEEPRYRLLETIRHYASDRLYDAGETASCRSRHLAWCVELARRAAPGITGPDQGRWLDQLDEERDNLWAALEWAGSDPAALGDGLRLGGALREFLLRRGHFSEAVTLIGPLVDRMDEVDPSVALPAITTVSDILGHRGERDQELNETALRLAREVGDIKAEAEALLRIGFGRAASGDTGGADQLREAIELARRTGSDHLLARVMLHYARIGEMCGDDAEQQRVASEALAAAQRSGDEWQVGASLVTLGYLGLTAGDLDAAEEHLTRCRELSHRFGFLVGLSHSAMGLMLVAARRGDAASIDAWLEEVREIGARTGARRDLVTAQQQLAHYLHMAGNSLGAVERVDRAIAELGAERDTPRVGQLCLMRAEALRVLGESAEARASLDRALAAYAAPGVDEGEITTAALIGAWLDLDGGQPEAALAALRQVLSAGDRTDLRVEALRAAGEAALAIGDLDLAVVLAVAERLQSDEWVTPLERPRFDAALARWRDALGSERHEAAEAHAAAMTLDDAVALVLQGCDDDD